MLLKKLFGRGKVQANSFGPSHPVSNDSGWFSRLFSNKTTSGITVTENVAMGLSAVWGCVLAISQTMGVLPRDLVSKINDQNFEPVAEHQSKDCIEFQANDLMTTQIVIETLQAHAITWGNGYAELQFLKGTGYVQKMWPIPPDRVTPLKFLNEAGQLDVVYQILLPDGTTAYLPKERVLHIAGFGYDGVCGYPLIRVAANSVGLGKALDEWAQAFFGKGSQSGGYVTLPEGMTPKQVEDLKAHLTILNDGLENAHRLKFLYDNVTYTPSTINPEAAQFLQSRGFQIEELCRWMRVQPYKIGHTGKASYNSLEQLNKEFYSDTMLPWVMRWQNEIRRKFFLEPKDKNLRVLFRPGIFLQADTDTRGKYYRAMALSGLMLPDEVRGMEGLAPLPNGEGAKRMVPANIYVSGDEREENNDKQKDAQERVSD